MAQFFFADSATKHLARRHSYTGIDEIARVDLGFGARQAAVAQPQQQQPTTMAGVPTGPRAIPTGPRSTLVPGGPNGSSVPVYAQAAPPVAVASAPVVVPARAPAPVVAAVSGAATPLATLAPATTAAVSAGSATGAGGASPGASPAKRPLEDDRSGRHPSVDRTGGAGPQGASGERMSMRNEPLSKRHRADSPATTAASAGPAPAAVKREQSPMLHKLPENKPSPSQNATLGWFVGLLPPAGMFDGASGASPSPACRLFRVTSFADIATPLARCPTQGPTSPSTMSWRPSSRAGSHRSPHRRRRSLLRRSVRVSSLTFCQMAPLLLQSCASARLITTSALLLVRRL